MSVPESAELNTRLRGATLVALVWAGLFASACSQPQPCTIDRQRPPPPRIQSGMAHGAATVGEYFRLQLMTGFEVSSSRCSGDEAPLEDGPRTFEVTVVDPLNAPVAFDRLEDPAESLFFVGFMPTMLGKYFVLLRELPNGVLIQAEVLVVHDRLDAGLDPVGRRCSRLDRTSSGTWLCGSALLRDGGEAERFGHYAQPVVRDDVIWSSEEGRSFHRWVDHGGRLTEAPAGGLETEAVVKAASFSRDELLLVDELFLRRFHVTDAGFALTGEVETQESGVYGLHPVGDVAFVVSPATEGIRACGFELHSDGGLAKSAAACQLLSGVLLGGNETELWMRSEPVADRQSVVPIHTLHRYVLSDGGLEEQGRAEVPASIRVEVDSRPLNESAPNSLAGPNGPELVARYEDGGIILERYALGLFINEVRPGGVSAQLPDGGSVFVLR